MGRVAYTHFTFEQLNHESDRLARGLQRLGVKPGTRLVLMVRPSLEFIALTFALFKAGAVVVLIDPGMGRTGIFNCLDEVQPEGFIAIPIVQAIRVLSGRRFSQSRWNVTVGGRRWFWGGSNYRQLLGEWDVPSFDSAKTRATDPAAIIFTSGSTGPPKGVLYEHGMFAAQVELIRDFYQIQPGEIDLPGFPLFALFNSAMGVTTVIPDMDPTRPAKVDPTKILEAISNQGVTQAFGSPAIWNRVGRACIDLNENLGTLKRVLSAGAPVPPHVIERVTGAFAPQAKDLPAEELANIHTPYGATEALPVASISGREILAKTAILSRMGLGTCVGRAFPHMRIKIIAITEGAIANLAEARELHAHQKGEIIVSGPVVTREYFRKPEATKLAKIQDGDSFWHRMGDVGYLDDENLLWFCGRKAHVVRTRWGMMFTICCEAIFNQHPKVYRSALVGIGNSPAQCPVIIVEPEPGCFPQTPTEEQAFRTELLALGAKNSNTKTIKEILFHPSLPVDIRHNVKIFREKLAPWAQKKLPHILPDPFPHEGFGH